MTEFDIGAPCNTRTARLHATPTPRARTTPAPSRGPGKVLTGAPG